MTQTAAIHPRGGWQPEETDLLFGAIRTAAESGTPLRDVFMQVGQQLNRKPNSIRNYYYACIKERPELAPGKTTFRAFDREELHLLLRDVLMARGRGESVRACVTRRAGGDRSAMLRYQNKYRSILKNHPEMLLEVAKELRSEGLPCPVQVAACRRYTAPEGQQSGMMLPDGWHREPGAAAVVEGLDMLLRRLEAQAAALREREEARSMQPSQLPEAAAPEGGAAGASVPYEKWLKTRQEADRLRVEVDLLKIALEEAEKGAQMAGTAAEPAVGESE